MAVLSWASKKSFLELWGNQRVYCYFVGGILFGFLFLLVFFFLWVCFFSQKTLPFSVSIWAALQEPAATTRSLLPQALLQLSQPADARICRDVSREAGGEEVAQTALSAGHRLAPCPALLGWAPRGACPACPPAQSVGLCQGCSVSAHCRSSSLLSLCPHPPPQWIPVPGPLSGAPAGSQELLLTGCQGIWALTAGC